MENILDKCFDFIFNKDDIQFKIDIQQSCKA